MPKKTINIKAEILSEVDCDLKLLRGDMITMDGYGKRLVETKVKTNAHITKAILFKTGNSYGGLFKGEKHA